MADNDFFVKVNKVSENIDSLLEAGQKVENIDTKISDINDKHSLVIQTKEAIDTIKQEIDIKNSEIKNLNVETLLLATGSNPSIDYNSSTGKLTIGIPKGDTGAKGDVGEAFKVDKIDTMANRTTWDNAPKGFSFLAVDNSNIYFKQSDDASDWSGGVSFGKGATGNNGADITMDTITDNDNGTFTWHFSDGTQFTTSDLRVKGDKGDTGATGAGVTDNQTAIVGMGLWTNTANVQKIKIEGIN
jgi:cold shock CspA family protein